MLRMDFTSQDYLRNPATGLAELRQAGPVMEVRFPIIGNGPEIDVAKAAMSFRWAASASLDPTVNSSSLIGKQRIRRLSLLNPAARFNVRCKLRKCLRRRACKP